ncbi:MAG TPA: LPS assembly lipoprotein LptE [Gallionella sp.]|nr:LPS assembly lipoprotein LptE [Gallionella sp.]
MRLLVVFAVLLLTACGFHPRGQAGMPFSTLYIDAAASNTPFIAELRRNLEFNNVKLVHSAEKADVVLNIVFEIPEKQILSLGGSGRVNEYLLRYRVSLRAYDNKGQDWIPAEEMAQRRDYTYSDAAILAKEAEEALLYKSMRDDMVQQIVRRLSRAKPQIQ